MKNLYQSKKIRYAVTTIIVLGVLLIVFQAGVFLGYHKAMFSSNLGDNYYRNFEGNATSSIFGSSRLFRAQLPGGHGAVGKVVSIGPTNIVVATGDNVEESIQISDDTMVRHLRDNASITDIKVGDSVIVIGFPNLNGEIEARLIRIQ